MQAIILAAGMGRRLGELTKNHTKCMVKVNGERLIDRLLKQLSSLKLNRVVLVVGYEGENLKSYIGNRYADCLQIEYVLNPIYDKTNNIYSLALAKNYLQEDDTLLIESDLIVEKRLFSLLLENPSPNLALVAKYEAWMDGTMVRVDDDGNIADFIPKKAFKYSDISQYYKTVNIYKFSKSFSTHKYVPFLEAYIKTFGNNAYYEQVLSVITFLEKTEMKALPIGNEKWYEIDDIQDLDIAETLFSEGGSRFEKYMQRYGGYWRFPGLLDFCCPVNPYFPSPRMLEELHANFDVLLTRCPSEMHVNTLLTGKYFNLQQAYIVLGNSTSGLRKCLTSHITGKIGMIFHTYEEYFDHMEISSLELFIPKNSNFHYSVHDLTAYFEANPISALLLVNPDNPSGNFIRQSDLRILADWCEKRSVRLIVDESFVDFSTGEMCNTLLRNELLEAYPNLIVIRSISKSNGMQGLPLSVLASSDTKLIALMRKDVSIRNLNSFAEFYMQIYGKYEADYQQACEKLREERHRFYLSLQKNSFLRIIPSEANYFLCEVLPPYTSRTLAVRLLNHHDILIKDYSTKKGFDGGNYIRIAIRNRDDNEKLLMALKDVSREKIV